MILLIDNNDSFTHNVLQLLQRVTTQTIHLRRGVEINIAEVEQYSHIIFSPGPGLPADFPIMAQVLQRYDTSKSILGICLGHQAICQYYGGTLSNLARVVHGQATRVKCDPESILFHGVESMVVGRYHSWVVQRLPDLLRVTATDDSALIMAVEHTSKRVYGVQFHPESYITKQGETILRNFIYGIS